MRTYAIWGTATSSEHEAWVRIDRRGLRGGRLRPGGRHRGRGLRPQHVRSRSSRRRSAGNRAGRTRPRSTSSTTVPDDVLKTSYPMLVRTLANVVVLHVPGEGVWFTTMERGTYRISRRPGRRLRAARAAREVEARDRQRVRPRPRARALGRRRGDGGHRGCRQADAGARPPPRAVPGARVPRRARPPPRDAALPGRRPLVRQPLRPQGRDALLDERERRRQVAARGAGPRHPARHGLRRAEREDA